MDACFLKERQAENTQGAGLLPPTASCHKGGEVRAVGLPGRWARELAYSARSVVYAHPAVYMPLARIQHRDRGFWVVGRNSELVIEGFSRSASTFAVLAFESAQHRPVRIAHHTHAAAQVITAARKGIPTLVIVRDPVQVTASHMARRGVSARSALAAWIRYHEHILPCRDRVVVASFEAVTADFGAVIREINAKFGTDFDVFDHTEANEAHVFERIDLLNREKYPRPTEERARALARPTAEREEIKRAFLSGLDADWLAGKRARADALRRALVPSPTHGGDTWLGGGYANATALIETRPRGHAKVLWAC